MRSILRDACTVSCSWPPAFTLTTAVDNQQTIVDLVLDLGHQILRDQSETATCDTIRGVDRSRRNTSREETAQRIVDLEVTGV